MFKKYFCFAVFTVILTLSAFTETLAIACFQNEEIDDKCRNVTGKFEDLLFEPFFESGFIVTSLPSADLEPQKEIKLGEIEKFFEEPSDYILICRMQYGKDLVFNKILDRKIPDWKTLKVSLVNFSTGKEIYTKIFDMTKFKEIDPEKKCETVSVQVAKEAIETINKDKRRNK
ncbi:hypothetical protein [Treponema pedis]|uniref:Lipoprotein n=2 Tax=Treponema pedis TaxID=409322 RepID=S5ZRD3_9SPIR|nr:hypothetical protein [Treponema pedis]AGT45262.1 hypothetical protein TPE_2790 [Treponema pedis str. T A4]QOW60503.1 hypothetical protein IFE08_11935 [Treponema pedis]QSI05841.1 hypothetical protein DYQ05_13470 [Treponema pedis]